MSLSCSINFKFWDSWASFLMRSAIGTGVTLFIIIKLFVDFVEQFDKKSLRVFATYIDLFIICDSEY